MSFLNLLMRPYNLSVMIIILILSEVYFFMKKSYIVYNQYFIVVILILILYMYAICRLYYCFIYINTLNTKEYKKYQALVYTISFILDSNIVSSNSTFSLISFMIFICLYLNLINSSKEENYCLYDIYDMYFLSKVIKFFIYFLIDRTLYENIDIYSYNKEFFIQYILFKYAFNRINNDNHYGRKTTTHYYNNQNCLSITNNLTISYISQMITVEKNQFFQFIFEKTTKAKIILTKKDRTPLYFNRNLIEMMNIDFSSQNDDDEERKSNTSITNIYEYSILNTEDKSKFDYELNIFINDLLQLGADEYFGNEDYPTLYDYLILLQNRDCREDDNNINSTYLFSSKSIIEMKYHINIKLTNDYIYLSIQSLNKANLFKNLFLKIKTQLLLTIFHELNNPMSGLNYLIDYWPDCQIEEKYSLRKKILRYQSFLKFQIFNFCLYFKKAFQSDILLNKSNQISFLMVLGSSLNCIIGDENTYSLLNGIDSDKLNCVFLNSDQEYLELFLNNSISYVHKSTLQSAENINFKLTFEYKSVNTQSSNSYSSYNFDLILLFKTNQYDNNKSNTLDEDPSHEISVNSLELHKDLIIFLSKVLSLKVYFSQQDFKDLLSFTSEANLTKYVLGILIPDCVLKKETKKFSLNLQRLNESGFIMNNTSILYSNSNQINSNYIKTSKVNSIFNKDINIYSKTPTISKKTKLLSIFSIYRGNKDRNDLKGRGGSSVLNDNINSLLSNQERFSTSNFHTNLSKYTRHNSIFHNQVMISNLNMNFDHMNSNKGESIINTVKTVKRINTVNTVSSTDTINNKRNPFNSIKKFNSMNKNLHQVNSTCLLVDGEKKSPLGFSKKEDVIVEELDTKGLSKIIHLARKSTRSVKIEEGIEYIRMNIRFNSSGKGNKENIQSIKEGNSHSNHETGGLNEKGIEEVNKSSLCYSSNDFNEESSDEDEKTNEIRKETYLIKEETEMNSSNDDSIVETRRIRSINKEQVPNRISDMNEIIDCDSNSFLPKSFYEDMNNSLILNQKGKNKESNKNVRFINHKLILSKKQTEMNSEKEDFPLEIVKYETNTYDLLRLNTTSSPEASRKEKNNNDEGSYDNEYIRKNKINSNTNTNTSNKHEINKISKDLKLNSFNISKSSNVQVVKSRLGQIKAKSKESSVFNLNRRKIIKSNSLTTNLNMYKLKKSSFESRLISKTKNQLGFNMIFKLCKVHNEEEYYNRSFNRIDFKLEVPNLYIPSKCYCNDILIIDDESINVKAMKLLLKKQKLNADSCSNGLEAVNKVKDSFEKTCCEKIYKIMFFDLMMPVMKGDEASEIISNIYKSKGIDAYLNIIIVSAHESSYVIDALKKVICFKLFIPKPPNKRIMEDVIYKYYLNGNNFEKVFSQSKGNLNMMSK